MSGKALTNDMRQLYLRHGLTLDAPAFTRPADEYDHVICIEGIASTPAVDQERVRFLPHAFTWTDCKLLYDHATPAGTVDELHYDADGRLLITATVTHSRARRCNGLSVSCKVRSYQIRNADDPRRFTAEITRAELTEVSLVDQPVNAECKVLKRSRLTPQAEFHHLLQQKVLVLQRMTTMLKETNHADH